MLFKSDRFGRNSCWNVIFCLYITKCFTQCDGQAYPVLKILVERSLLIVNSLGQFTLPLVRMPPRDKHNRYGITEHHC